MPYKDPDKQRAYCKTWMSQRRKSYFTDKSCYKCGSADRLEIHHLDRKLKTDHKVWSWTAAKRDAELAKCQVLCHACHKEITIQQLSKPIVHGTASGYTHYGCRCPACTMANRDRCRWQRATSRIWNQIFLPFAS